jgi:hypothetical protein
MLADFIQAAPWLARFGDSLRSVGAFCSRQTPLTFEFDPEVTEDSHDHAGIRANDGRV